MIERMLWTDVSVYQPRLEYGVLRENGVMGLIAKSSQGSRVKDRLFSQHMERALEAGMKLGVYHWCDPTCTPEGQLANFLEATAGWRYELSFAALDVEQYWAKWSEWPRNIQAVISGKAIADNAWRLLGLMEGELACKVMLYTRLSFMRDRSREMEKWAWRFPLWMASYPYAKGKVVCDWETFYEQWQPRCETPLPAGAKRWTLWQFSGDKFVLPGSGGSAMDLNYFNGTAEAFEDWAGLVGEDDPAEPEVEPFRMMRALARLNVRDVPGRMGVGNIIGKVEYGEKLMVLEETAIGADHWVRCKKGWVARLFSGVKLLEEV